MLPVDDKREEEMLLAALAARQSMTGHHLDASLTPYDCKRQAVTAFKCCCKVSSRDDLQWRVFAYKAVNLLLALSLAMQHTSISHANEAAMFSMFGLPDGVLKTATGLIWPDMHCKDHMCRALK